MSTRENRLGISSRCTRRDPPDWVGFWPAYRTKSWRRSPRQGKWSIQEIAQHLADAEIMGATRLRQALAEPGTSFAVYDQAAWARTLRYGSRDRNAMVAALWLFSALRSSGTRLFNGAREEDWKKWGSHADWGRLTVRQLLELYADHGERHIEQIVELRLLLGTPVNVPRLFPTRLY